MRTYSIFFFAFTAFSFAVLHNIIPSHWLPYVMTAHAKKWRMRVALFMAAAGAVAHIFTTAVLGLAIGFLGEWLKEKAEFWGGILVSVVVIAVGTSFIIRGWRNLRHGHSHAEHCSHGSGNDGALLLGLTYGLRPCAEAAWILVLAGAHGIFASLAAISAWVFGSVGIMVLMTALGMKGLKHIKLEWLEKYTELISGFIIILTGLWSLFYAGK